MAKRRTAQCACGKLTVTVQGDPNVVFLCNCTHCQRRTGSIFGVSAFFADEQVLEILGERRTFVRGSDSGRSVAIRFCPECGSSVFWTGEGAATAAGIGVAVGAFCDPDFPKPTLVAWCPTKYRWAAFPAGVPVSDTQSL